MSEWEYELEDLEDDDADSDVLDEPLEPGSPSLENALFVVLGVALAVAAVVLLLA